MATVRAHAGSGRYRDMVELSLGTEALVGDFSPLSFHLAGLELAGAVYVTLH